VFNAFPAAQATQSPTTSDPAGEDNPLAVSQAVQGLSVVVPFAASRSVKYVPAVHLEQVPFAASAP